MNVYETVRSRVRIESDRLIKMFGHFKIDDNAKAPSFYSFRINAKNYFTFILFARKSFFLFFNYFSNPSRDSVGRKIKKDPAGCKIASLLFFLGHVFSGIMSRKVFFGSHGGTN